MNPEELWALLIHRFAAGFPRKVFMDLDDWEMNNALGRPDFHKGDAARGYWPMPRTDPNDPVVSGNTGMRGVYFNPARVKALKLLGVTQAEMEQGYQEWISQFNVPGMK